MLIPGFPELLLRLYLVFVLNILLGGGGVCGQGRSLRLCSRGLRGQSRRGGVRSKGGDVRVQVRGVGGHSGGVSDWGLGSGVAGR